MQSGEKHGKCSTDRHLLRQLQTISTGNHYRDAAWNSSKAQRPWNDKKKGCFKRERERNTSKKERDRWTIYTQQQFSEALNNASEWVRSSAHATHDSFAFQHHWRRFFSLFFGSFQNVTKQPCRYTNQKKKKKWSSCIYLTVKKPVLFGIDFLHFFFVLI